MLKTDTEEYARSRSADKQAKTTIKIQNNAPQKAPRRKQRMVGEDNLLKTSQDLLGLNSHKVPEDEVIATEIKKI